MPRIEMLPDGPVYKGDNYFRKNNNAEILPEDSAVSARISDDKKKNPNKIDEPEKHFYHFGKGDDELTLGVYSHTDFFLDNINEYWYKALRFNLTRAEKSSDKTINAIAGKITSEKVKD